MEDRIKVACRVRPGESNQAQTCAKRCATVDNSTHSVIVNCKPEPQSFGFDFVGGKESQEK